MIYDRSDALTDGEMILKLRVDLSACQQQLREAQDECGREREGRIRIGEGLSRYTSAAKELPKYPNLNAPGELMNGYDSLRTAYIAQAARVKELEAKYQLLKEDGGRAILFNKQRAEEAEAERDAAVKSARQLAANSVHQYQQMQRDLYRKHHTFDGPVLDALNVAMQDAYGSPTNQEKLAIDAAVKAEGSKK